MLEEARRKEEEEIRKIQKQQEVVDAIFAEIYLYVISQVYCRNKRNCYVVRKKSFEKRRSF